MNQAHLEENDSSAPFAVSGATSGVVRSSLVRAAASSGYAAGDILAGKYQLVEPLGSGGMGAVWRAHSLWLDVPVAIKVLHREQVDAHAAERLLREARATARLGHPAIVRVFDFGETEAGEPFLVMELLEGTSLADWLERHGRMSPAQAVQMILPMVGALAAAHALGIVHRDIKPGNILVVRGPGGALVPKIVDFGIAKVSTISGPTITLAGSIVGSPHYMSPEQADGMLQIGEQSDVWSLCVVLYELITGTRPFEGDTLTAIISALLHREPTPTTELDAGDEELWAIIERGLRKSSTERWPNMRALGRVLALWASQRGIVVDAAGTSLAHRWLAEDGSPMEPPGDAAAPPETQLARPGAAPFLAQAGHRGARGAQGATRTLPSKQERATVKIPSGIGGSPAVAPPARTRVEAIFAGLIAIMVAPLVLALRLQSGGFDESAVAAASPPAVTAAMATAPFPVAPAASAAAPELAAPPVAVAPVNAPADPTPPVAEAPARTALPAAKERDRHAEADTRPRRKWSPMPLPPAPDF